MASICGTLNPGFTVKGHFQIQSEILKNKSDRPRARIQVHLIDIYEREHKLLPGGYIHKMGPMDDWYFKPSEEELTINQENV